MPIGGINRLIPSGRKNTQFGQAESILLSKLGVEAVVDEEFARVREAVRDITGINGKRILAIPILKWRTTSGLGGSSSYHARLSPMIIDYPIQVLQEDKFQLFSNQGAFKRYEKQGLTYYQTGQYEGGSSGNQSQVAQFFSVNSDGNHSGGIRKGVWGGHTRSRLS